MTASKYETRAWLEDVAMQRARTGGGDEECHARRRGKAERAGVARRVNCAVNKKRSWGGHRDGSTPSGGRSNEGRVVQEPRSRRRRGATVPCDGDGRHRDGGPV